MSAPSTARTRWITNGCTPYPAASFLHPFCQRWQAHQHCVGIMAGFQSEFGAPVVHEVVFGIEPAMDELHLALGLAPGHRPAPFHQRQEGRQEGAADVLREGKIG